MFLFFSVFFKVYNSSKFFFISALWLVLSAISLVSHYWILVWLLIWLHLVSFTYAASPQHSFPNIPFSLFSDTVQSNFGRDVSLATVLAILFTLVENPDLLNLHFQSTKSPVFWWKQKPNFWMDNCFSQFTGNTNWWYKNRNSIFWKRTCKRTR